MGKTATLNLRVDPTTKEEAEIILSKLGISMATAIDMYLKQISLVGGIPFAMILPKHPKSINTDLMSTEELRKKLDKGYSDMEAGNVQNATTAFTNFMEKH